MTTDGKKLEELLANAGKTTGDLADATGKSRQMVSRYLKTRSFKPNMLATITKGLKALGINPDILEGGRSNMLAPGELRALLNSFNPSQLIALKSVLELDAHSRTALVAIIEDRLERR